MRVLLLFLLNGSVLFLQAQKNLLIPGSALIQQKWIANEYSEMNWYMVQGTSKILLGNVINEVQKKDNLVYIITTVKMKQFPSAWVDSTIAVAGSLKPVYHSSFNSQRTMDLRFDKFVTGNYHDFIKKTESAIRDTIKTPCFDSNLYPVLLRWLPLKDGYVQDISIYDYNPKSKSGVMKASVTGVKKGMYESDKSGKRSVWVVTVTDEISEGATSTYFIDQLNRKVWKQEIDMPGRRMLMEAQ